jgi:hypothetical protein
VRLRPRNAQMNATLQIIVKPDKAGRQRNFSDCRSSAIMRIHVIARGEAMAPASKLSSLLHRLLHYPTTRESFSGRALPMRQTTQAQRTMCRRTTAFLLVMLLGLFLSLPNALAQDDQTEPSPLSVTTQFATGLGADCNGGEGIVVKLHYVGTQPLRGYLIRLAFAQSVSGKITQEQYLQEIRDLREAMIASGAEWTRTLCAIPKKIRWDSSAIIANVDVLKFADNSIWGPAALSESHQLIGALDGMDFVGKATELQKFVSPILPEQGPLPVEDVEAQTIGPLKIESGIWHDEHGRDMLAVDVTNESSTPIRGYLMTTTFFDPASGARIRRVSTKELETHGNASDYLAPGGTWVADPRKFSYLADGSRARYKINLDLVVFADGSIFGPKKSRESDEVIGMLHGVDAANLLPREVPANQ